MFQMPAASESRAQPYCSPGMRVHRLLLLLLASTSLCPQSVSCSPPSRVQAQQRFQQLHKRSSEPNSNSAEEGSVVSPPHCSRAIITVAHGSRLTKRAAPPHPNSSQQRGEQARQLSLNIAVGQSVCFKMSTERNGDSTKESSASSEMLEEEVLTQTKSNFSFIVALAGRTMQPKRTRLKAVSPDKGGQGRQNVLHSITVLDLEQYHSITERYRFAIPELETRCICECESGTANCAADRYKYGQCASDDEGDSGEEETGKNNRVPSGGRFKPLTSRPPSVCHRTFFANQPAGRQCSTHHDASSSARLCCQLRFRAHRNRQFTALRLEPAVSSALIQYSQWAWREPEADGNGTGAGQHWEELERRRVRVQLDGAMHNAVLSEYAGLKLSVLGLSSAKAAGIQLEPDVYFAENLPNGVLGELVGQLAVNRITEHDFHKLGWFRLDERGTPFVQSGEVFMDRIHHARVEDCTAQRFRSVLDASYYVNADDNDTSQFKLPDALSTAHKWIRSARVLDSQQRVALVRASEGLSLEVTLSAKQRPSVGATATVEGSDESGGRVISFVHNSSRLGDFTALLVIDRFSNSLLNLTLFNSSGVLNGFVRPLGGLDDGGEIDGFTVNVPSEGGTTRTTKEQQHSPSSVLLRIRPFPLGSIHIVCLRPDDAELWQELCRPVQSVYHELETNTVRNEWSEAVGECPKCNQITAEGFAKYLNPANWVKGINSVGEAFMLVSDIVVYCVFAVVLVTVLTKVVIPLIGCCCVTSCTPSLCKTVKK